MVFSVVIFGLWISIFIVDQLISYFSRLRSYDTEIKLDPKFLENQVFASKNEVKLEANRRKAGKKCRVDVPQLGPQEQRFPERCKRCVGYDCVEKPNVEGNCFSCGHCFWNH